MRGQKKCPAGETKKNTLRLAKQEIKKGKSPQRRGRQHLRREATETEIVEGEN